MKRFKCITLAINIKLNKCVIKIKLENSIFLNYKFLKYFQNGKQAHKHLSSTKIKT